MQIGSTGNKMNEIQRLYNLLKLNIINLQSNMIVIAKRLRQLAGARSPCNQLDWKETLHRRIEGMNNSPLMSFPSTYYNRHSNCGALKDGEDWLIQLEMGSH